MKKSDNTKPIIFFITHCFLSKAYQETLSNFIADLSNLVCYGVDESVDLDSMYEELRKQIKGWGNRPIYFVTDLIISSSSNIAFRLAKTHSDSKVICGANLRLLIELLQADNLKNDLNDILLLSKEEIRIIKE